MKRSSNYQKVKTFYSTRMWNESRVRNAVKMSWITADEFKEITGKEY